MSCDHSCNRSTLRLFMACVASPVHDLHCITRNDDAMSCLRRHAIATSPSCALLHRRTETARPSQDKVRLCTRPRCPDSDILQNSQERPFLRFLNVRTSSGVYFRVAFEAQYDCRSLTPRNSAVNRISGGYSWTRALHGTQLARPSHVYRWTWGRFAANSSHGHSTSHGRRHSSSREISP